MEQWRVLSDKVSSPYVSGSGMSYSGFRSIAVNSWWGGNVEGDGPLTSEIRYIRRKYTVKRRRISSISLKREAISALDEPDFKRQRIYADTNNLNSEQVRANKRNLDSGALPLGKRQKTCRSTSPPNSTASRDEEPPPKKRRRIPNTTAEYIPDKTPLKTEYHRKKTKKERLRYAIFSKLYD